MASAGRQERAEEPEVPARDPFVVLGVPPNLDDTDYYCSLCYRVLLAR